MASKEIDSYIERPTTFVELAGTSIKSALDVARKYGAVHDSVLKFSGGSLFPGDVGEFYTLASELRIRSYFNLTLGFSGNNVKTWRRWIAEVGPILTRLNVDDNWMNAKKTAGKLDVYDEDSADGGPRRGDRRLPRGRVHRAQQLGHRLGRQGLRLRVRRLRQGGVHRGVRRRPLDSADGLVLRPAGDRAIPWRQGPSHSPCARASWSATARAVIDCTLPEEREACERLLGQLAFLETGPGGTTGADEVTFSAPPDSAALARRALERHAHGALPPPPPSVIA